MLKPLSLTLTILGILTLSIILITQSPLTVSSPEQLTNLTENQRVQAKGIIIEERIYQNYKVLTLDNELKVQVPKSTPYLLNKPLAVLGVYDNFQSPLIKSIKIKY